MNQKGWFICCSQHFAFLFFANFFAIFIFQVGGRFPLPRKTDISFSLLAR